MKNVGEKIMKIFSAKVFRVDITSSDLNEFWIGQKILKAESLLLNLSATFIGFETVLEVWRAWTCDTKNSIFEQVAS